MKVSGSSKEDFIVSEKNLILYGSTKIDSPVETSYLSSFASPETSDFQEQEGISGRGGNGTGGPEYTGGAT